MSDSSYDRGVPKDKKVYFKILKVNEFFQCYEQKECCIKERETPKNPDAYRGIALEDVLLKTFTKIIKGRLAEMIDPSILEEQFGFREGRSNIQAVRCLQEDIQDALRHPKGKLYTVKRLTPSTETVQIADVWGAKSPTDNQKQKNAKSVPFRLPFKTFVFRRGGRIAAEKDSEVINWGSWSSGIFIIFTRNP
ncbi:hypothetical protein ANN_27213 [Periplaneta americana]|uniref:Reverse transcriptase domain-containing protein n=1 Tax=Periplaneta americana TaxID=6978 RepID=A0ABQ8RXJ8_PERAM|nr:hypothetical protein ANN_27213 [Periplaneta americana]